MSFIKTAWTWLKKEVNIVVTAVEGSAHVAEQDVAKVVVTVVEELQAFLKSGTAGFLESVAVELTKSNVPTEIVNALNNALPDVLAAALAVEGLPQNATTEQVLAFETAVLTAFGINAAQDQIWTTTGAVLVGGLNQLLNQGTKPTFGQLATLIETTYQAYKSAMVVPTPPPAPIADVETAPIESTPSADEPAE